MQLRSRSTRTRGATRILIADDDALTRRLLEKTLESSGYEVVVVEDGRKALECLSRADGPRLALHRIWSLADDLSLSIYDAAYLELAQRKGLPLASRDAELRGAATKCGIPILL